MSTTDTRTGLEPAKVKSLASKINAGAITLKELANEIAPEPETAEPASPPPLPRELTAEQRKALRKVVDVFGSVVPTERRTLTPAEMASLYEERTVLDRVEKMAKGRKDDIRAHVLIHHDVEREADDDTDLPREKDGHYVPQDTVRYPIPETDQDWSLEPKAGSAGIDEALLKSLAERDDVPEFTHEDYLACTEQRRVFDENKTMLHLKKNPKVLEVLAEAMEPKGKPSITVTTRKRK